jgi:hypothetical protein
LNICLIYSTKVESVKVWFTTAISILKKIVLCCRCTGTIVGISDYDPIRWPNSKWRNLQVEWDEHGYGERPERVSVWDIETLENTLVFSSPLNSKRQCLPSYGGTSLYHSLGVLRIIQDDEMICFPPICSSRVSSWICKYVINSKGTRKSLW